jgi:hypothetical protein
MLNDLGYNSKKAQARKAFMTWWMPDPSITEIGEKVRVSAKFAPHAKNDYIKFPPDQMKDWRKTVLISYTDRDEWFVARERVPIDSVETISDMATEPYLTTEDIDVMLIFALPPRYWINNTNDRQIPLCFYSSDIGSQLRELGLEDMDHEIDQYFSKDPIIEEKSSAMTKKQRKTFEKGANDLSI